MIAAFRDRSAASPGGLLWLAARMRVPLVAGLAGALLSGSGSGGAEPRAVSGAAPLGGDGLGALRRLLEAPIQERALAVEALAAELDAGLGPALSSALAAADLERRVRIEEALGCSNRALELLLALLADNNEAVRASAERALGARLERFAPGADAPFVQEQALPQALRQALADEPQRWFEIDLGLDPRLALQRLGRAQPEPLPLILDPALARTPRGFPNGGLVLRGSLDQLAPEIARRAGLELVLARAAGAEAGDAPRSLFLCLALEGQPVGATARGLLLQWARELALEGPEQSAAAATALCLSGWEEALGACATLGLDRGHAGALIGVLEAAARGRVVPQLLDPKRLAVLLQRALEELGRPGPAPFAAALRAALEAAPRLAPDGQDLTALVLGLPSVNDRTERFLLHLAAGFGGTSAELERRLRAAWSAPPAGVDPALRREALLAAARLGSIALGPVGDGLALLPFFAREEDALRLARAAERARARLDPGEGTWLGALQPRGLSGLPTGLLSWLEAACLRLELAEGQSGPAAARLGALLSGPEQSIDLGALVALLEDLRRDGRQAELEALIEGAERVADENGLPRLEDLAAGLGLADPGLLSRVLPRALAQDPPDLALLATLAGSSQGGLCRERLLALLRATLSPDPADRSVGPVAIVPLFESLGSALDGLYAQRLDEEARKFQQAVVALARRAPQNELAQALLSRAWPAAPGLIPEPLRDDFGPSGAP